MKETEDKYKLLFEGSPDAIIIVELNGIISDCNKITEKILGFEKTEFMGKHFNEIAFWPESKKNEFSEIFNLILEEKLPQPFELEISPSPNRNEWFKIFYNMLQDGSKPFAVQLNIRKITERKINETQLKNENIDYQILINAASKLSEISEEDAVFELISEELTRISPNACILLNKASYDGKFLELIKIQGIEKKLVFKISEIMGVIPIGLKYPVSESFRIRYSRPELFKFEGGLAEFSAGSLSEIVATSIEKILQIREIYTIGIANKGAYFGSLHILVSDKNTHLNKLLLESFMHLCYLAISRIRSIRKLEESEKLYRLLANNVKDVIFTLDLDLKYTYVSPSIKLLRGYEPSEVIGNHIISTISGESIKQVTNVLNEQIKQARLGNPETKKDYVMEIELSKKDKGSIWTEIKASFVFDNKNNPIGILGVTRDINERKQTQGELMEKNMALNEANAQKDKFFSIIAHDLKGPFSNILNFTTLLDDNYKIYTDEKRKQFIQIINKSAKQTYLLLENLLDWARSQRDIMDFTPQSIQLQNILSDIEDLLSNAAQAKNISIKQNIASNFTIQADEYMLKTVLRNLIGNAIKFTGFGGTIEINAERKPNEAEISINDNGIGIAKEDAESLFSLNTNFTATGTGGEKGTGLGLILCKDFIEKHGGKIWVESVLGKGSSFKFTLPFKEI